jgi:hypothetical protein
MSDFNRILGEQIGINAAAGLVGKQLILRLRDNRYDPSRRLRSQMS